MGEGIRTPIRHRLRSARGAGTLVCILLAATVGACGGGSSSSSAPVAANAQPSRPAPTNAPGGTMGSDLGFRPEKDGFAFDNYGNEIKPANLSPAEVRAIFGDQVCSNTDNGTCDLIPPAQKWMDDWNMTMAGGHCYGFSVTALLLYRHQLDPTAFGAPSIGQLTLDGNQQLQRRIAESFVYQGLDSVQNAVVTGAPDAILDKLATVLTPSSTEVYTLGIRKADGTGGHAVTPYALVDRGNGVTAILVYDNNWHGVSREVDVDRNANTWKYTASTNPAETSSDYSGDANTQTMALYPTSPATGGVQPCPFCGKSATAMLGAGRTDAVLANDQTAVQTATRIAFDEIPPDDPNFVPDKEVTAPLIADGGGGQLGFSKGQPVDSMSDGKAETVFLDEDWTSHEDPMYDFTTMKPLHITVDGSQVTTRNVVEDVDVTGTDGDVGVDGFAVPSGGTPMVDTSAKQDAVRYTSAGGSDPPDLYTAVDAAKADFTFDATPQNLAGGDSLTLGYVGDMVVVDGRGLHQPTTVKLDVDAENAAGDISGSDQITVNPGAMIGVNVGNFAPDSSHDLPAATTFNGTPDWQFAG